ncbi:hypothetical protein C8Q69DRAFT_467853 [Paecilomyces variotii]|uniref:Integral membrane protein n=1 Tax=Byssochlamys spectabilis TaxID=264951 RepID=A0A443HVL8_BYSSP|nr:hypothetical protein C8Q69DRAFT_467853 [Paecilomyces variotii]RWQ95885.1 hypothetical protein C8Q69DRAFT_467853 [Paecilomyces variotii]
MAPSSRISQSRGIRIITSALGTVCLGLGITDIIRPQDGLALLEFHSLPSSADQRLSNALMSMVGVRDLFMASAIYAASYFGTSKTLGWILFASGGVAFGDGMIARANGLNFLNHWVFVPIAGVLGSVLLGAFDKS